MMEVVLSIKRAGADIIITYFAKEIAEVLNRKYFFERNKCKFQIMNIENSKTAFKQACKVIPGSTCQVHGTRRLARAASIQDPRPLRAPTRFCQAL